MPDQDILLGALVPAAGEARRMGGPHKLLAEFDGIPLIRRVVLTLLSASFGPVTVVTGHRRDGIEAALHGLDLHLCFNPGYRAGMGGSLACGFADPALAGCDGVLVMLADMPAVTAGHLGRLAAGFRQHQGRAVVRAACDGRPGNPVIIPKALYGAMRGLSGDTGAKGLITQSGLSVVDTDIGPAALLDVDTPDALIRAGGVLRG